MSKLASLSEAIPGLMRGDVKGPTRIMLNSALIAATPMIAAILPVPSFDRGVYTDVFLLDTPHARRSNGERIQLLLKRGYVDVTVPLAISVTGTTGTTMLSNSEFTVQPEIGVLTYEGASLLNYRRLAITYTSGFISQEDVVDNQPFGKMYTSVPHYLMQAALHLTYAIFDSRRDQNLDSNSAKPSFAIPLSVYETLAPYRRTLMQDCIRAV